MYTYMLCIVALPKNDQGWILITTLDRSCSQRVKHAVKQQRTASGSLTQLSVVLGGPP
jgi:hypothetical protein